MKLKLQLLDRLILSLLSFIVLIDMINGFFMMEFTKLPVSQLYKLTLVLLMLFRLSKSKDFYHIIILLLLFQLGPILGFFTTGNFFDFANDVLVSTKWFNVPLSFFYFKNLFQGEFDEVMTKKTHLVISRSFKLVMLNVFLGVLGFGMAFYNHGFKNAVGTKGFIYAGNELTILILALAFMIATFYWQKKDYKKYCVFFLAFVAISFFITSKTVIAGTLLVFAIPPIASIKLKIKKKWVGWIMAFTIFGIPALCFMMYLGITNSGIIDKINYSMSQNDNNIVTVILSNRNNFIEKGWDVYINDFPLIGKIMGYGQKYHLELSGHLAEVDFFSLLFASGIIGVLGLLSIIIYWHFSAVYLKRTKNSQYVYAMPVLFFLWFLVVIANLSGHIFGSGIAGFFIGMSLAIMFFRQKSINEV